MSRAERDAFFEEEKKKGLPSESSGGVVLSGEEAQADPTRLDLAQQLAEIQEEFEIDDPTSPVSTSAPDVLRNAMRRGADNAVAISESIKNDQTAANLVEVGQLTGAYQRAIRAKDYDTASSLRDDMANLALISQSMLRGRSLQKTTSRTLEISLRALKETS